MLIDGPEYRLFFMIDKDNNGIDLFDYKMEHRASFLLREDDGKVLNGVFMKYLDRILTKRLLLFSTKKILLFDLALNLKDEKEIGEIPAINEVTLYGTRLTLDSGLPNISSPKRWAKVTPENIDVS